MVWHSGRGMCTALSLAPGSLCARCTFAISYVHTSSCHVMPFLFALVFASCADPDSSARFSGSCCGSWAWQPLGGGGVVYCMRTNSTNIGD